MATVVEIPEVNVSRQMYPIEEFDRVKSAVCLLRPITKDPSIKTWTGTGFYVHVKLKKQGTSSVVDVHCIMTNYHVYLEKRNRGDDMVAVFHHDSTEKKAFELPLVPFKIVAQSKYEDLDYVLIRVNGNLLRSVGVQPLLADMDNLPVVEMNDTVYIIQHPVGMKKHLSHDKVKRVNKPFIEYFADTLRGSSGSPVLVLDKSISNFLLVALHSTGVYSDGTESNWNRGVLLSDILEHLHTGKVTKPSLPLPGVPGQIESGDYSALGTKDPSKLVTRNDIMLIAKEITDVWEKLGRVLGHSDSTLKIIDADNPRIYDKCYEMLIKWTQIMVSKATYGVLAAGFVHPTVERPDLITKFC